MHEPPPLSAVLDCIDADADAGRLAAWGRSTVIDEYVGGPVVDEALFARLHDAAGIDACFPVGNAGLMHVYGYLFSDVHTPFGYKRDRWNDGVLATRLGLPASAFRLGDSADETPLARVTAAALPLLLSPPEGSFVLDETVGSLATRAVVLPAGVLAYGIDAGDGMRVVTLFPVADAAAFAADAAAEPPRLRWNAVAPA